ncbi:GspE/PulE family protein [Desmospora profundinema]|uniref:Type II secretory ATPase GspE/PulE/Tfp pilus assembly ATPase PilB-like protein n=1 Tax=Desmospora profundinema TaxID=1571184 RepID=A0ABU1IKL2_9BACL|nr:GspE/PulE family protein [Desmospora profundinema]MDR6224943.1 type II secretory ATPase GspE/PulE/Tfp pilus assembly ATPase PilB-like protein [Desmospora profundinema]
MDAAQTVTELLKEAIESGASDLHLEPRIDHVCVRQRVDGFLVPVSRFPKEALGALVSRIKVMAHMDIGEKRLPQDGAMAVHHQTERVDIRVSSMPMLYGEKLVLRLLRNRPELLSLSELGMGVDEAARLKTMIGMPGGFIIVTGPTGTGKTTTLYAMLQELNRPERNVVTLEDPVEYQLPGVNQVQINRKAGLTFAMGLRAVLRQDPDVIMVGEVRDRETADIAIRAALTGHKVLTTLHTTDAPSTITRLLDMEIEPYKIASALTGVIAQRLIRLICSECRGPGCEHCHQTGYRRRTGAFEVLLMIEEMQPLVVERASLSRLRQAFNREGMRSLQEVVLEKVLTGQTTVAEYHRVVEVTDESLTEKEEAH